MAIVIGHAFVYAAFDWLLSKSILGVLQKRGLVELWHAGANATPSQRVIVDPV